MAKKATIGDVAHAAGVSKGLVSLALNGRPGVSAEARQRIETAVRELRYRPSTSARGLATQRAYALGLVVRRAPLTFQADPFFASFVAGVETVLAERNQVLVLSVVSDEARETAAYQRLAEDRRVDGFLITDLLEPDPRIELMTELGQRAVTLGRPMHESPFPAVIRDYDAGIEELVVHLAGMGHQRIGHVTGDERMQHARSRKRRFEQVMERLGLKAIVEHADFSSESGAVATHRLLDKDMPPTAIIYANDPMAIAGVAVAYQRGLTLPTDLSIAGMDGTNVGRYIYPALTTLDNDPVGWGRATAASLLEHIETGQAPDVTLPPARLVVRASTAPPRRA